MPNRLRTRLLIFYSTQDDPWLQRLLTHLQPLENDLSLDIWNETRIQSSADCQTDIDQALRQARVIVLLVSADFLTSAFISEYRLAPRLAELTAEQVIVIPLLVGASLFEHTPSLAHLKPYRRPEEPLSELSTAEQKQALEQTAQVIHGALSISNRDPGTPQPACKILFLAASPIESIHLALGREARSIRDILRASKHRDAFTFHTEFAVRPRDLLRYLREQRPHIVHFSGHGNLQDELELEDDQGAIKPVSKAALTQLFKILQENIRVVVLNACYSSIQAEAITEHIDCAIGMKQAIDDEAAIVFAAEFYGALGDGCSVYNAFEQGKLALDFENISEENIPQLIVRNGVDANQVILTAHQR